MINRYLLLILTSLVYSNAHAEGGCPAGYYPHNAPGLRGCAPIPGYEQGEASRGWVDAYGTLVWWNSENGDPQYAYSAKYTNEAISEKTAMKRCRISGGGNCSVAFTVTNGYIAIGRNESGGLVGTSGQNSKIARKKLLDDCADNGSKCEILEVVDTQGWAE